MPPRWLVVNISSAQRCPIPRSPPPTGSTGRPVRPGVTRRPIPTLRWLGRPRLCPPRRRLRARPEDPGARRSNEVPRVKAGHDGPGRSDPDRVDI